MDKHEHHKLVLPVLSKLYKEKNSNKYIDVTDCFTMSDDDNTELFYSLKNEKYIQCVREPLRADIGGKGKYSYKYEAKIALKGVTYYEQHIEPKK